MSVTFPPSLWASTACAAPETVALPGDIEVDAAVIGAGFTGLSAARSLAAAGRNTVVLEAAGIGFGASGRNNGQVIPTLTRPDPDDLVARYGPDVGPRFVAMLRDSAQTLFDLVRRYDMDCEAEQNGWLQPAHSPGRLRVSEKRVRQWQRYGADVDMVDAKDMQELLGSRAYHGGWTARTGGTVNPLALARELARAALQEGATIYTETPVMEAKPKGDRWHLHTPHGRVTANALVVASNAYTDGMPATGLFRRFARQIVPVLSWQLATHPLSDNLQRLIVPGRQAVSDTHGDLHFFRYDRNGRLVTGGALVFAAQAPARLRRRIGARLQRLFPELGEPRFDFVWNGRLGMTPDYCPRVHRFRENAVGWTGCNGRGVALSVAIGQELARAVSGAGAQDLSVLLEDIKPVPLHGLVRHVAPAALIAKRWRDAQEVKIG